MIELHVAEWLTLVSNLVNIENHMKYECSKMKIGVIPNN